jgi:hypothetical protein
VHRTRRRAGTVALTVALAAVLGVGPAVGSSASTTPNRPGAGAGRPFLRGLSTVTTIASSIPANGDENPYAVLVAPFGSGTIRKGDVLVDNFNSVSNERGTGTTIVVVEPSGATELFAEIPRHLSGCPGGVGLTAAMTMLPTGWVIVGSTPTAGGTTGTAGVGCLIVLSSSGKVEGTISGPEIDGPWDMTAVDGGATATLLLTNTLIGVRSPGQPVVDRGDLVRITLHQSASAPPKVVSMTVIASGLPEQPSTDNFVVGPTGVAYESGTAYVADQGANSIVEVRRAMTRTTSTGPSITLSAGGDLRHPLAMAVAPNGDLIVTNRSNGDIVEVTTAGRQVAEVSVDPDPAQSPPGAGDLFGLAVAPSGRGVYFAKDDTNTIALLS